MDVAVWSVAESLFQRHPARWEPASVPLAAHERRTPIVFRIQIGGMTGRRAAPETVRTSQIPGDASEAGRPQWLAQVLRRVMGASTSYSFPHASVSCLPHTAAVTCA